MKANEFKKFEIMINQTADLIGRPRLTEGAINLFFDFLKRYTFEQILQGLALHMNDPQKGQYMPKPADIIAALVGDPEALASQAWAKVNDAVTRTGAYESVVFDDPVIHAVISDMGGWMDLCRCQLEDYKFREHGFLKRYKAYLGRNLGKYPKTLVGESEIYNRANGHEVRPPMMIGDPVKALEVQENGSDTPRIEKTPLEQVENMLPTLNANKMVERWDEDQISTNVLNG